MARRRTQVPRYCHHKASGRAVTRVDGRDHYLGSYGSSESHEAYSRLIAEWRTRPSAKNAPLSDDILAGRTVNTVLLGYRLFVFIWWSGNGDLHLKNFRLLTGDDGITRLTPACDVLCTELVLPDNGLAFPLHRKTK